MKMVEHNCLKAKRTLPLFALLGILWHRESNTGCSVFIVTTSNVCIWEMKHPVRIAHVKNCYEKCIDSVQRQFIQYAFYLNQLQAGNISKRTCTSHD